MCVRAFKNVVAEILAFFERFFVGEEFKAPFPVFSLSFSPLKFSSACDEGYFDGKGKFLNATSEVIF